MRKRIWQRAMSVVYYRKGFVVFSLRCESEEVPHVYIPLPVGHTRHSDAILQTQATALPQ